MKQKTIFEKMINLNDKKVVSAIKTIMTLLFEIDSGSIYIAVALMSQDTMVQL